MVPVMMRSRASPHRQVRTTAQERKAKQEVLGLETEQIRARLQRDLATLDHIFADDFVFTNSRGERRTKARVIADYKRTDREFKSYAIGDVRVRTYGDTALVTGHRKQKARVKGENRADDVRFIRVYVKREGRWQLVAGQVTPILTK